MAVNLLSPRITQGYRNQRDNLTVSDAALIVADLEALNNAGGGGGVTSVSGDIVDNTVPTTPVINIKRDQTLSDVQANNGTYTAGSWVQVTEPIGSITGSADTIFPVIEGGFLAGTGWCQTFENSGMAASRMVKIDWDVTTDFVSAIEEPVQGNRVTAHYSSVGLENFPFDTTTMFGVNLIDPNVCAIDVAAIIKYSTFEGYNTITIAAGATHRGRVGQEATVGLSGTSIYEGTIGYNGGVTLIGTQALIGGCYIGDGENVDCSSLPSDYTQTGKFIGGGISTFQCDEAIDVVGSKIIIDNVSGADFSFCGVFTNLITSGGLELISDIDTNSTTHDYTFYVATGGFFFEDGAAFNVPKLFVNTQTVVNDMVILHYNPLGFFWLVSPMSYLGGQGSSGSFDAASIAANSATFEQGIFKGVV